MHLVPPEPSLEQDFNITYDLTAYGEDTPIETSFPTYMWQGVSE